MPTYRTAAATFAIQATQYDTGAALNSAGAVCGAYFGPELLTPTVDERSLFINPRIASRKAVEADMPGLVGRTDPYSLNFLDEDTITTFLTKPDYHIFLAEDSSGPLAWGLALVQTDINGQYCWFDRLTNRTRLYNGVDVDGDPVLGPLGEEAFGLVLETAARFFVNMGVTRSKYMVPAKMLARIKALYDDPRFSVSATILSEPPPGLGGEVEVIFGP